MGYDLNRFIGEIDDEFQCSICTMVLEDPLQTTCEHSFCGNCIKDWLLNNQTCPLDRMPLTISDVKPVNRQFRNLWNKLDIKCDFESLGCPASTKLENLVLHVSSCEYYLNSDIVCDKGCNMTITRREYQSDNCFSHLANRVSAQEEEIIKVRHELSDQKEDFRRLQDENRDVIRKRDDEIRKINEELSRQRSQLVQFEIAMKTQLLQMAEQQIAPRPLKWKQCDNVKIVETNILKSDVPERQGYFTSHYPLEPEKFNFKVHILNFDNSVLNYIALSSKPGANILTYYDSGSIHVSYRSGQFFEVPKWKVGDIIECGVIYPEDFINNGDNSATVYISRNKEIIFNDSLTIPKEGLYPHVSTRGNYTRIQYFQ